MNKPAAPILTSVLLLFLLPFAGLLDLVNGDYDWPEDSPESAFIKEHYTELSLSHITSLPNAITPVQEQEIWNYLYNKTGSPYAAAGLMGNLYAESGLAPNNLQNTYETSLGFSDQTYTASVDSGIYTNFENDRAGYGLAQWTSAGRKKNLLAFARECGTSISDLQMQLDFLWWELSGSYSSVLLDLRQATSVKAASDIILMRFEMPADQSMAVQRTRAEFAQYFFDSYYTGTIVKPLYPEKNNLDLVQWVNLAYTEKWGYVKGTFGNVLTRTLYEQKKAQYPEIGRYDSFILTHWIGRRTADCVGLIKGYSWYDAETGIVQYAVNGMPDIDQDAMFLAATEFGPIDTIPEIPGLAVWKKGHIGVYIGNGEVIEAMGTEAGVKKSQLEGRDWTHWLKIPYIEYINEAKEPERPEESGSTETTQTASAPESP